MFFYYINNKNYFKICNLYCVLHRIYRIFYLFICSAKLNGIDLKKFILNLVDELVGLTSYYFFFGYIIFEKPQFNLLKSFRKKSIGSNSWIVAFSICHEVAYLCYS